jgi:hypothetical protein
LSPKRRPAPPSPPRQDRRRAARLAGSRDLLYATGLTLLAWLHRLLFLASNRDRPWPFTIFYEGDAETYFRFARTLLAGKVYDNGVPYHPPGFALLLAGVHSLLGAGSVEARIPHLATKATLALFASLAVGLLYLLVRPYLGQLVAALAALLAVYHFGLAVLALAPVTEGAYLTLLTATLLLWSRRFDHSLAAPRSAAEEVRPGWKAAIGLGLLLGAMALTRAESVLVSALLVAVGLLGAWKRREAEGWRAFRVWGLVVLAALLTVAPWTIRNAKRLGDLNARLGSQLAEPLPTFVPLTVYGPLNLALANNARADGTFSRAALPAQAGSDLLELSNPKHLRYVLHGDRIAWDWIRADPGAFARLLARKWTLFFSAWKLGWTQWDLPGGLKGTRQPVDVFTPDSWLAAALSLPFALLGLLYGAAIPGGPRRWTWIALLLAACGLFTTGLFFGYVRQGLLVLPFTLPWIATGLAWCVDRLRRLGTPGEGGAWSRTLHEEPPSRRFGQGALVLVLLLAVAEMIGARANRNYQATGTTIAGQSLLNRDAPVRLEVLPD